MVENTNYEKEFLDDIFTDVSKLDYTLLKTRYFPQLSVYTKSNKDSIKIRAYYELAKKFSKEGILYGFGLYGDKSRRWVETVVIPQDFIDFYIEKNSSTSTQASTNNVDIQFEEYDEENYILKLTGIEIKMAKKGKDNDATLLLKSLLKIESGDWKHDDDVFEDWGYNLADLKDEHRNKVYFAAKAVNDNIAKEIQLKDFVSRKGTETRINPKYRKLN